VNKTEAHRVVAIFHHVLDQHGPYVDTPCCTRSEEPPIFCLHLHQSTQLLDCQSGSQVQAS
jgi:hypothetical protein